MTTIDPLGALARALATLRQTLRHPAGTQKAHKPSSTGSKVLGQDRRTDPQRSPLTLLAPQVAALRADEPMRKRKALRLFIEAVLLEELGQELALDGNFQRIVDRSLEAIEADESMKLMVDEASIELLGNR
jgi:hypothetical protein